LTPEADNAAVELVKSMPDWTPGKQAGENVNVFRSYPVNFK